MPKPGRDVVYVPKGWRSLEHAAFGSRPCLDRHILEHGIDRVLDGLVVLDAELAATLVETINRLRGTVSILFIAHECPAALQCDQVVRLPSTAPAHA